MNGTNGSETESVKRQLVVPGDLLPAVFGQLDAHVKKIEQHFHVTVVDRDGLLTVAAPPGNERGADKAHAVLSQVTALARKDEAVTEQQVNYLIASLADEHFDQIEKLNDDTICLTHSGRPVKPKTVGQKKYIDQIRRNTVVFAVGPAGTGKTYLAMAMAVAAFRAGQVSRIILTRPAIEAGEKLGFLPGDLQQKVDPYLRPLYDALHEIMGAEAFTRNQERGQIEVAPLAYMRGRTLDNSFIVLDEAQNTTPEQMKMFLTRLGFGSKAVVNGDVTQIDLPEGKRSGMNDALRVLGDIPDIALCALTHKDVVRHALVQKIIQAYEKAEAKAAYKTRAKDARLAARNARGRGRRV